MPMGFERKNKSDSRCSAILFERLKVAEKADSEDNVEQRTAVLIGVRAPSDLGGGGGGWWLSCPKKNWRNEGWNWDTNADVHHFRI